MIPEPHAMSIRHTPMRPIGLQTVRCGVLICILAGIASLSYSVTSARGEDTRRWPEFRGPSGDGHARQEDAVPMQWSEQRNIVWKQPIHGRGWSSPVVVDNQIWITTASEDGREMYVVCVDFQTGKLLHDRKLLENASPSEIHKTNSYASPTPLLHGGHVVLSFGSYGTICLDRSTGDERWRRTDLPCEHWRGPGSSPIAFEDSLILHFDGYDYQYIIALELATGKTIWKQDRDIDYGSDDGDIMKAFSTPLVVWVDDTPQLISPTSKATLAYDPRTGQELWRFRYEQFSATARPLYAQGVFFLNSGFSKAEMFAVRAGGQGDITDTHLVWHEKRSVGSKPSATLVDGRLYVLHDTGVLSCLDATTGDRLWTERLGGNYSASPIFADGKLVFADESGITTVVKPGDTFQKLATNELSEGCMASPAVYKNSLIWRTTGSLYRISSSN